MNTDSDPEQLNFYGDEYLEEQADTLVSERNTKLNNDYYLFQEDRNLKRKPNLPIENFRHKTRKYDSDDLLVYDVSGDIELDEMAETVISADKAAESNNNTQSAYINGDRHPAEMIECETDTISNVRNLEYQMQRKRTYEASHWEEHDRNKKRKENDHLVECANQDSHPGTLVRTEMETTSVSVNFGFQVETSPQGKALFWREFSRNQNTASANDPLMVHINREERLEVSIKAVTHQMVTSSISESVTVQKESIKQRKMRLFREYCSKLKNNRLLFFKSGDGMVVGSTETTVSQMGTAFVSGNVSIHVESQKQRKARLWSEYKFRLKIKSKNYP